MKKIYSLVLLLMLFSAVTLKAEQLKIFFEESGFCSFIGVKNDNVTGFQSPKGYANVNNLEGAFILWSIDAAQAGTYKMRIRYAFGGGTDPRIGKIMINESVEAAEINFVHTGTWTNWAYTDDIDVELNEGINKIRIVAQTGRGLPNTDFLEMDGVGLSPAECLPSYTFAIDKNFDDWGTVSYEPIQQYYDEGTEITVTAVANDGYFFHNWNGQAASTNLEHTFEIRENTALQAMFYPDGTVMNPDIIGYASIQDDKGTPFMLIGGELGTTVLATNEEELRQYLDSDEHYIVQVDRKITGSGAELKIKSNKTLIGINESANIEGIRMQVDNAQNVILENIIFSLVPRYDLLEITHSSRNIWINKCEFFNERLEDKDYYDGLIDIKNAATHITIARSKFHEHHKSILVSSGDGSTEDHVIRLTFHHNHFYNLGSRVPSLRFGKAHIFNNYYQNVEDGVNARMGACVRVEKNYFRDVKKATFVDYSAIEGMLDVVDNVFNNVSSYSTEPSCVLNIPYQYQHVLDDPKDLPMLIAGHDVSSVNDVFFNNSRVSLSPNPLNKISDAVLTLEEDLTLEISVVNMMGQKVDYIAPAYYNQGQVRLNLNNNIYSPGFYLMILSSQGESEVLKIIVK